MSKEILTLLLNQPTRILHKVRTDTSISVERAKELCINARKNVNKALLIAKLNWAESLAEKFTTSVMPQKKHEKQCRTLKLDSLIIIVKKRQ